MQKKREDIHKKIKSYHVCVIFSSFLSCCVDVDCLRLFDGRKRSFSFIFIFLWYVFFLFHSVVSAGINEVFWIQWSNSIFFSFKRLYIAFFCAGANLIKQVFNLINGDYTMKCMRLIWIKFLNEKKNALEWSKVIR